MRGTPNLLQAADQTNPLRSAEGTEFFNQLINKSPHMRAFLQAGLEVGQPLSDYSDYYRFGRA